MSKEYNFEYAVSLARHSGLGSAGLDGEWFKDYDSAYKYAQQWGYPFTVYFVVNRKWIFYCKRSAVENKPYALYNIRSLPGYVGQVETKIWWSAFVSEPEKFLDYAEEVLDNA
ncbi:MAG: hypothetical protein J6R67_03020 [Treponema sp.]|nr:hypothetical protein [Treponema sp.]